MFKKKKPEGATDTGNNAPAPLSREQQSFTLTDFEVLTTLGTGTFGRVRLVKQLVSSQFFCIEDPKKIRNHSAKASGPHQVRNYAAEDDSASVRR